MRTAHGVGRPFQLAILDYSMRVMDGLALARAVHDDPALRGTPLIMFSSVDLTRSHVATLQQLGVGLVLLKPVRQSALLNVLMGALALDESVEP